MSARHIFSLLLLLSVLCSSCKNGRQKLADGPRKIEILFLGHASDHHPSAQYAPILAAALAQDGINITYTDKPTDLNPETLSYFDGLILYANHDSITVAEEKALLDFVEHGKGFIPIHCASFCFRNSDKFVNLVGGQFLKHDTATFTASIINKEHPSMQSLSEFSTWDETYVHHLLTDDRTTLMERIEGDQHEPWTWVRSQGKGRVFYTAYGHDNRTWENPGFQQLILQGIVWAVGDGAKKQWEDFRKTIPKLVYKDVPNIPNYEKRNPPPQYQEPLSPDESRKLIQVAPGFDFELFVSEPDIINPIAMDWDEKGRLWVIETVDYPNSVRDEEGVGDDRIKICEDTDGDGKADKFTVFADKLNIPTSLVFANGGIIVSQAPYFLFLKDTNGDDKADVREILIEGWGTFDTHAGPSNLKYGFDNKIWGTVGYSGFKGTIAGRTHEFSQGFYRFAPDASSFEFLTKTSNNTWGLGITENNDIFGSTANNTHSVFMGITQGQAEGVQGIIIGSQKIDGHYAMHPITNKVRQVDVFGGFTAASGHNFYTARAYPDEFRNVAFVCEPTGHLVHMARIEKDGAGFVEKDGWNLFAGADEWVSPVEAKVGPDGAVWVLDWYNFIIQHNPTPTPERGGFQAVNGSGNAYENPLRDKSHGRVWRIVHREMKHEKPIQLSKDRVDELVKSLGNDNMFWRMTAQRLIVEIGNKEVKSSLIDLVKNEKVDKDGNNFSALHALWTLDGLNLIEEDSDTYAVAVNALKHPASGVRRAAVQILSKVKLNEQTVINSGILNDSDPGTRLAAILALVELPPSDSIGDELYSLSQDKKIIEDDWLAKATYVAAAKHHTAFIKAYMKAHPDYKTPEPAVPVNRETAVLDDANWKTMKLPQNIEKAGLEIDGIIWFRVNVEVPKSMAGKKAILSIGPVDESDVTWLNGLEIGSTIEKYNVPRAYQIPAGRLKAGKNSIAVRVEDKGGRGGIHGKPEEMFLLAGKDTLRLDVDWKYDVEKEYSATRKNIFKEVSVADVLLKHYGDNASQAPPETEAFANDATVIRIKVIKNEMKYDLKTFTVEAGKAVEIIFENPDFMQHNLVITKQGTMKIVGAAADKLAADPKGAEMNYVPAIPEVLFATRLVNPEQTETLRFIAPKDVGDYPYVCTFPGHWALMNGLMKVVKPK